MEKQKQPQELSPLSASKTKTLENCSWSYWCNYHLKLPQGKNEGAQKGEVCHWVFEILIKDKYKSRVSKIIQSDTIQTDKPLDRLIKIFIKRAGLPNTPSIYEHVLQMVMVGLKNDFYVKGGKLVAPEFKFDISKPTFRIKGFMDKPFIVGKNILIDDYKSSKQKFKGEEEESNVQALFYSYAAKQLWPELKPIIRFIFLQYPKDPIMTVEFSEDTLRGFEMYLTEMQKRVNVFNEISAKSSFAADREPKDDGFNGKLLCGFAKTPDQKKKDGTKMWHCPYKFAFKYYVIKKDGKIVKTYLTKEEVRPLENGEVLELANYEGCPRHRNAIDTVRPKVEKPQKYANAIDDF